MLIKQNLSITHYKPTGYQNIGSGLNVKAITDCVLPVPCCYSYRSQITSDVFITAAHLGTVRMKTVWSKVSSSLRSIINMQCPLLILSVFSLSLCRHAGIQCRYSPRVVLNWLFPMCTWQHSVSAKNISTQHFLLRFPLITELNCISFSTGYKC